MKKKTILIYALTRSPWIGGIYYRKNIINMMLSNNYIIDNYNILLVVNENNREIFNEFSSKIEIIEFQKNTSYINTIIKSFKLIFKYKIKYIFPIKPYSFFKLLGITPISWIADFQHCYFPQYFSEKEINRRNSEIELITRKNNPLVISSHSSNDDFKKFYSDNRQNVYVVHFTSYVEDELMKISKEDVKNILVKYGVINSNYIIICNQFWQHKNHMVVLEAINELNKKGKIIKFVFTGELSDRRNPDYINKIKKYINENKLNNIIITGFISRQEQLTLMKESSLVIQPSLFEGWGTVVEDAKKLGKKVILSDIAVHREQMDSNCILFDPLNKFDLVDKISINFESNKEDIICEDFTNKYAEELCQIFKK